MRTKKGLRIWHNPRNGFKGIELHYTADPDKRTDEWLEQAKFGMDEKNWATEFELSWETYGGEPVYGSEFNKDLHIVKSLKADPDVPFLFRGWDFGGNHSAVVCQHVDGQLRVLAEFPNRGFNTRVIAKEIVDECTRMFGDNFKWTEFIDPSGLWEGKTSTGMACADVMRGLGLDIVPGIQEPTKRIDAVMKLLVSMKNGKPCFLIDSSCSMLINGFCGGYHYPEKVTKNQKSNKPDKNDYSHIHDALQYVCTRLGHQAMTNDYLNELAGIDDIRFNF